MSNNILKGFISELEKRALDTDFTTTDDLAEGWAKKDKHNVVVEPIVGGSIGAALGYYLSKKLGGKGFKTGIFGASLGAALAAMRANSDNKQTEAARRWLKKTDSEKARTNTFDKPFDLSFPIIPGHNIQFYQKGLI